MEGKGDAPGAVEPSDTKAAKPADPKAAPGEKPAAAEEADKPAAEGDAAAAAPAEGEAKPAGEKKKGPGGAVILLGVCLCTLRAAAATVLSSVVCAPRGLSRPSCDHAYISPAVRADRVGTSLLLVC